MRMRKERKKGKPTVVEGKTRRQKRRIKIVMKIEQEMEARRMKLTRRDSECSGNR